VQFAPNNGQGGCTAIEDAAALANHIKKLNDLSEDLPDTALIEKHLKAVQDLRYPRIKPIDVESRMILRGDTLQGPIESFMVHYVIPKFPDFIENSWVENWVGSCFLDYLPVPKRARMGTMMLNTKMGYGENDRLIIRVFRAFPLVFLFFGFYYFSGPRIEEAKSKASDMYTAASSLAGLKGPRLNPNIHGTASPGLLDFLVLSYRSMIENPIPLNEVFVLWADFIPIYGIWIIEGYRRGTSMTFAKL
jgi:hypothetical protein